ncbi:MAG: tRNA epoxyqueuosine(34) reductase QueG [Planctomycetia bacterium]|jgi:epoxyqueuosine reductase|nr:tRNA epoxyqueuosine(34) reductase QueG [Planctomycetia bacterium]MCC7314565.1 tRNA epoxyqueuosine(34) reductase QueG [Planctomycetota bacterium]OQY97135.1 MAG: tRNA epoxyqueuosine(34) reductase QueG [Planctomycetes bacterium UTPLA1]
MSLNARSLVDFIFVMGGYDMEAGKMTEAVKRLAGGLGFEQCGIAPAGAIPRGKYLTRWLAEGRAGRMGYLHRHLNSRVDLTTWLPWARSVIVVAQSYRQAPPAVADDAARGRVAMYAWGEDYHAILKEKLSHLVDQLHDEIPTPFESKICVDTSAITERELAAMAGIGWIGKNTLVLNQRLGSWFVLGVVITSLPLAADAPVADHCGSCTRCLDACPTEAFPRAYEMDARRCISYLTIEHRVEIDPELAAKMGDWVFGCDVCQEVCPFNRDVAPSREERLLAKSVDAALPALDDIAAWDKERHQEATAGRAVSRVSLKMWKRNAELARSHLTGDG